MQLALGNMSRYHASKSQLMIVCKIIQVVRIGSAKHEKNKQKPSDI